jgi:hypothetical protein
LEIDRACERVVAHQRDDAEVRERVERNQQGAGADRRSHPGEGHADEDPDGSQPQAPRRLLERGIELPQRRAREEKHIRIGGERQREERPPVTGDIGKPLDPERVPQQPAGAERPQQAEGGDVARDHERQGRGDRPHSPPRKVRSGHEPGQRDGDEKRCDRDPCDEEAGAPEELQRPPPPDDVPRLAFPRRAGDEVDEGQ